MKSHYAVRLALVARSGALETRLVFGRASREILRAAAGSASFTVDLLSKLNPWGLAGDAAMKVL